MTNGSRQSIGTVIGFWSFLKLEDYSDHFLDLLLIGPPITGQGNEPDWPIRQLRTDPPGYFVAVDAGHADVQQHYVRREGV